MMMRLDCQQQKGEAQLTEDQNTILHDFSLCPDQFSELSQWYVFEILTEVFKEPLRVSYKTGLTGIHK